MNEIFRNWPYLRYSWKIKILESILSKEQRFPFLTYDLPFSIWNKCTQISTSLRVELQVQLEMIEVEKCLMVVSAAFYQTSVNNASEEVD